MTQAALAWQMLRLGESLPQGACLDQISMIRAMPLAVW
jgi:hypothetical protein